MLAYADAQRRREFVRNQVNELMTLAISLEEKEKGEINHTVTKMRKTIGTLDRIGELVPYDDADRTLFDRAKLMYKTFHTKQEVDEFQRLVSQLNERSDFHKAKRTIDSRREELDEKEAEMSQDAKAAFGAAKEEYDALLHRRHRDGLAREVDEFQSWSAN